MAKDSIPLTIQTEHNILDKPGATVAYDRYHSDDEKTKLVKQHPNLVFASMCRRLSEFVSAPEATEEKRTEFNDIFFKELFYQRFVPAGRFWANAGLPNPQLGNCYVLPIEDSRSSIFNTMSNASTVLSGGGGVGYDFSRLRARGTNISTGRGSASGPIPFLKIYDKMAAAMAQSGSRRGAEMGILRVDHPDVLELVFLKDASAEYEQFNVSIAITEQFMKQWMSAKSTNNPWVVTNPYDNVSYNIVIDLGRPVAGLSIAELHTAVKEHHTERKLVSVGKLGKLTDTQYVLTVSGLWDLIGYNAWVCGDPGLVFIDTINRKNCLLIDDYKTDITNKYYLRATNPCSEQSLESYGICDLGALNLNAFVLEDFYLSHEANVEYDTRDISDISEYIDWEGLTEATQVGVRFLDNGLDASSYPLPEIEEMAKDTRRIGLGIMGWADMLIRLAVPYGSDLSFELGQKVMQHINKAALNYSVELGAEKGNFRLFDQSLYKTGGRGFRAVETLRNSYRTTIAPTGTTAILAGSSSGLEPIFNFVHERKDGIGTRTMVHKLYEKYVKEFNIDVDKDNLPEFFVNAASISGEKHVQMLAAFQRYVDNAISKTVNLDNSATYQDIQAIYKQAWKDKCKGITVYRDGSKYVQVLSNKGSKSETSEEAEFKKGRGARILKGDTAKIGTNVGSLLVTVNSLDGHNPIELVSNIGKGGSDINAFTEALGKVISASLQQGVDAQILYRQLIGIAGAAPIFETVGKHKRILSVPDAIGKALEDFTIRHAVPADVETALSELNESINSAAPMEIAGVCGTCGEDFRVVRGCKACACGSACED